MKEKKARVEDAMHATKAAVEEGIVPGGGVALLRCALLLKDAPATGDEAVGVQIIRRALEEPLRQIAVNAAAKALWSSTRSGRSRPSTASTPHRGRTRTWWRPASSIPPRSCARPLQNAASIASLLLTTEAIVSEIPADKDDSGAGDGMSGGY
jgi:chaperonin GroEL